MPDTRFRQVTKVVRAVLPAALLGLAGLAQAGSAAPAFGVHLRITGGCQVDSQAVFYGTLAPAVACRAGTPHSVRVAREALPVSRHEAPSADGLAIVVTLTF
jgi:hypothetical protein